MIDRNESVHQEFNEVSGDYMRKRQAYCQVIFKHFTKRFVKEYLLALQETHSYSSHKNHSLACSLKVGDLVLIKEDIIPRLSLKRGVVDQLITRHDGAARGAIIRTKSQNSKEATFIKRPLHLIVSLEADLLESEKQEPAYGQFGSKRLTAMNADATRRLTCT